MRHPPTKLLASVVDYLQEAAFETGSHDAKVLAEDLGRYVAKAPAKALPGRSRSEARRVKVQTRRESTKAIREEVMRRASGSCEFCLCLAHRPLELHHLEPGSGARRQRQAVNTCVAICRDCHRGWHHCPADFNEEVRAWAAKHDYPVPRRHAK